MHFNAPLRDTVVPLRYVVVNVNVNKHGALFMSVVLLKLLSFYSLCVQCHIVNERKCLRILNKSLVKAWLTPLLEIYFQLTRC